MRNVPLVIGFIEVNAGGKTPQLKTLVARPLATALVGQNLVLRQAPSNGASGAKPGNNYAGNKPANNTSQAPASASGSSNNNGGKPKGRRF